MAPGSEYERDGNGVIAEFEQTYVNKWNSQFLISFSGEGKYRERHYDKN